MKGLSYQEMRLFQSLIGFKINWNCADYPRGRFIFLFQSLIGFKINWNFPGKGWIKCIEVFQSLIGFKINWNEVIFLPIIN